MPTKIKDKGAPVPEPMPEEAPAEVVLVVELPAAPEGALEVVRDAKPKAQKFSA